MASPKREGFEQLAGHVPTDVMDGVRELASLNGRKVIEEVVHALRRHVAYPPTLTPLPAASVMPAPTPDPEPPAKKPKGRTRKGR